jgi:hypothetical protein
MANDLPAIDATVYVDSHGVKWRIIRPPGGRMFATMDQTGDRLYDPEPTDVGPLSALQVFGEDDAMEQQALVAEIEASVRNKLPALRVTPSRDASSAAGFPWLLVIIAAGLLLFDED